MCSPGPSLGGKLERKRVAAFDNVSGHLKIIIQLRFPLFSLTNVFLYISLACIWCQNDHVSTSMRRHLVVSTCIQRQFYVMWPLRRFRHELTAVHVLLTHPCKGPNLESPCCQSPRTPGRWEPRSTRLK